MRLGLHVTDDAEPPRAELDEHHVTGQRESLAGDAYVLGGDDRVETADPRGFGSFEERFSDPHLDSAAQVDPSDVGAAQYDLATRSRDFDVLATLAEEAHLG